MGGMLALVMPCIPRRSPGWVFAGHGQGQEDKTAHANGHRRFSDMLATKADDASVSIVIHSQGAQCDIRPTSILRRQMRRTKGSSRVGSYGVGCERNGPSSDGFYRWIFFISSGTFCSLGTVPAPYPLSSAPRDQWLQMLSATLFLAPTQGQAVEISWNKWC